MEAQGLKVLRPSAIEAPIKYIVAGERAVFVPTDRAKSYWPVGERRMAIADMRPLAERSEPRFEMLRPSPAAISLAFKLFDSDPARERWTGHTAFDDPTSAPGAPPRESIEIRTISFFAA